MASLNDPRVQSAIYGLTTIWNEPPAHRYFARDHWAYRSWRNDGDFTKIKFTQEEVDLIIAHLKVQGLWLA